MANFNIDYLVVAGGGGGGGCSNAGYLSGAGGGAGGMRTSFGTGNVNGGLTPVESTLTLASGISYSVTVGLGGAGMIDSTTQTAYGYQGNQGGESIFDTITSTGGGGGGTMGASPYQDASSKGGTGGSGGGSGYRDAPTGTGSAATPYNASPVQGFVGGLNGPPYSPGYASGGGGGAGGIGGAGGPNPANGPGGLGLESAITGTNSFYAGGGGGSTYKNSYAAPGLGGSGIGGNGGGALGSAGVGGNGTPNTGSGGGGGNAANGSVAKAGGSGAPGIVILRWLTTDAGYTVSGANPTETIDGAYTVLSFTAAVTSTITFTPNATTKISSALVDFNSGTEIGLKIPSGDDANQPTGVQGMIRNNIDSGMSFYNGTNWQYFAATESPDVVYPTSLKMYLDASDTTSYPGTGTTWFDLTSNANNGTINGATFSPSNASFDFNGSSDYISFSQFNISSNNKVTVELWTNPDSSQVTYANMFDYGHDGANGFTLQQNASSTNNYYVYNTGVLATNSITANTWTQFCFTGDGTNWKIYKNGALVSTATSSVSANTTGRTLNIGRWLGGTARYWNGQISKVRIYDTPLSGIEVTALYNEGR